MPGNALLLTLTKTDVTCNGYSNGSITSGLAGGLGGTVTYTLLPGVGFQYDRYIYQPSGWFLYS